MNAPTPIPTAERLPLMGATLAASQSARALADSFAAVDRVADDDHEVAYVALRSIVVAALGVIADLAAVVVEFDEEHSRPAPAVDDERVNWNLRPADRSVFADGPMSAGFVLIDRRSHSAGDALRRNVDGRERRVAGLIAWSPIRRQWEHWCGGRCSDVDPNVEALSNRHPEAPVHAPAEVDQ